MKNKYLIYTLFFIFFNHSLLSANDFIIDASEINVLDKGNITEAKNGVKITSNDNLEIISDKLIYDKKKSLLKLFGNVKISDLKNNIISEGSEYIYNKETLMDVIIPISEPSTKVVNIEKNILSVKL